jgi:hypothetical protein
VRVYLPSNTFQLSSKKPDDGIQTVRSQVRRVSLTSHKAMMPRRLSQVFDTQLSINDDIPTQ